MRLLYLTHRLPYAPDRGDRIRAYYLLREISQYADLSLFSLVHDDEEEAQAGRVAHARRVVTARVPRLGNYLRGAMRLASSRPLTHSLLDAPDAAAALARMIEADRPDVVLASSSGMARFALAPPVDELPLVLDMVDVDSEKWRALSATAAWPRRWAYAREARTLAAFEREASMRARAVLVVNARERDALLALAPEARVHVVPIGVFLDAYRPPGPPAADPVVVMSGVMDYAPNVEGALWFARNVWPRVRRVRPDARFVIVGASPTRVVRALAGSGAAIEVTGRVDSVPPYLWRAAVGVAPLRTARGLQNKVLEALAAGLPVVITPAVLAGLPKGIERGCVVADDPEAFAREVLALLGLAPDARREMAAAAGVESLGWARQLAPLRSILEATRLRA